MQVHSLWSVHVPNSQGDSHIAGVVEKVLYMQCAGRLYIIYSINTAYKEHASVYIVFPVSVLVRDLNY